MNRNELVGKMNDVMFRHLTEIHSMTNDKDYIRVTYKKPNDSSHVRMNMYFGTNYFGFHAKPYTDNCDKPFVREFLNELNKDNDYNLDGIKEVISHFESLNTTFDYFHKINVDYEPIKDIQSNFSKKSKEIKETHIGKAVYSGLGKLRNISKNSGVNYSCIKTYLVIISDKNNNYELGFKLSLPILTSNKCYCYIPITGTAHFKKNAIEMAKKEFEKKFIANIVSIIAIKNKLSRNERKALFDLSYEQLAQLYLLVEMEHY